MANTDMLDASATESRPVNRDEPPNATAEPEEASSSDGESYLAVSRSRRANAGNRMSKLLQLAEAEDANEEYGEIFQELANDEEFAGSDEEEDVALSSSDEDEDEGEQDEEAAEKALRKEEQINKRKRKREPLLQQMLKKKAARVMLPAPSADASKSIEPVGTSKKRVDRVSRTVDADGGPIRSSTRKLAMQSKEATASRIQEKEQHRLKTVAVMRAAERRREANRPKTLTQAERLAEAARIERQNSKTVSRWEEAERVRVAEQEARMAALKNRRLEGPVISYYSGPAVFVGDKVQVVGKQAVLKRMAQEDNKENIDAHTRCRKSDVDQSSGPGIENTVDTLERSAATSAEARQPEIAPDHASRLSQTPTTQLPDPLTPAVLSNVPPEIPDDHGNLREQLVESDSPSAIETNAGRPTDSGCNTASARETPVTENSSTSILSAAAVELPQSRQPSPPPLPPPTTRWMPEHMLKAQQLQQTLQEKLKLPYTSSATTEQSIPTAIAPTVVDSPTAAPFVLVHSLAAPPGTLPAVGTPLVTRSDDLVASSTILSSLPDQSPTSSRIPTEQAQTHPPILPTNSEVLPTRSPSPPPPLPTIAAVTLIALSSFPNLPPQAPQPARSRAAIDKEPYLLRALVSDPTLSVAKPRPVTKVTCSITDAPARYRDPSTGLPYSSKDALLTIKRIAGMKISSAKREHRKSGDETKPQHQGFIWSPLLGAWVGEKGSRVAAGVPKGFASPLTDEELTELRNTLENEAVEKAAAEKAEREKKEEMEKEKEKEKEKEIERNETTEAATVNKVDPAKEPIAKSVSDGVNSTLVSAGTGEPSVGMDQTQAVR